MMGNKDIMIKFINIVNNRGMLTDFIKYIFNYDYLFDYNYIFRMIDNDSQVIIDIYDNVSDNRFNRYIFDFVDSDYDVLFSKEDDVFVKLISVNNTNDVEDNIVKFGYLFKLDSNLMIDYANSFLDNKFVKLLESIIKNKPI